MHPAINGKDNCISIAIYCNRNLTDHIPKYSSVRDMNQPPTPQKQLTQKKKVTETASTTILFRRLHSFGLDSYLKKHSLNEELMIAIWNKHSRLKLTSRQIQHSSWPESGRHLWFPSSRLSKHTLQTSQWNDLSWWILEDKKLSVDTIGQLHDDDIWLQLPEFISVLLCYLNLSIPLRIKEHYSSNLCKKTTNSRILVVVVKWRHRAIVLSQNTKVIIDDINPIGPKSVQHQFSPNNISRSKRVKVMRINKLMTKGRILWY